MKFKKSCETCEARERCFIYVQCNSYFSEWNKNENFCNKYVKDKSLSRKKRNIQSEKLIAMILDEASSIRVDGKISFEQLKQSCIKILDSER